MVDCHELSEKNIFFRIITKSGLNMTYLYFFNNIILMGHIVLLTKRVLKKFWTVYSFHISCIVQSAQKRVKRDFCVNCDPILTSTIPWPWSVGVTKQVIALCTLCEKKLNMWEVWWFSDMLYVLKLQQVFCETNTNCLAA